MTALTSIEQIVAEGRDPAYVVFALPDWEHFHPTDLPVPITDWIARHCPEFEIRRVYNIPSPGTALFGLDQHHDEITSALEIAPVFLIGFNDDQAEAFAAAWTEPDGSISKNSEFYFCDVSRKDDPGIRQYDGHGVYWVPDLLDGSEHDQDHPASLTDEAA